MSQIQYRGQVEDLSAPAVRDLAASLHTWHTSDPSHRVLRFDWRVHDGVLVVTLQVNSVGRTEVQSAVDALEADVTAFSTPLPFTDGNWRVR